jgi:hypothetical protein
MAVRNVQKRARLNASMSSAVTQSSFIMPAFFSSFASECRVAFSMRAAPSPGGIAHSSGVVGSVYCPTARKPRSTVTTARAQSDTSSVAR